MTAVSFRRAARVAIGVILAALAGPALAQSAAEDAAPEESRANLGLVLIVSLERVRAQSEAALSIESQAEAIRQQIQEQLGARQQALAAEEQALVALRRTLESDAFEARAARFEQQVRLLKKDRRDQADALRSALRVASDQMEAALRPILAELMAERGGSVLIDTRNVILSVKTLDITDEVIKRLDETLPSLEVRWPPEDGR